MTPSRVKQLIWIISFGYFFYLMFKITIKYIPFNTNIAFLNIKQTEVQSIPYYLAFFYIHVYSSLFCLIAGFTQFNKRLLKNKPKIHRNIGKLYILIVLLFSAPSGFIIGLYANGGLFSKISFIILAILWFLFTLKAFLSVKKGKITQHKKFMYRSFALAFSAITLRLWKVILVYLFQPNPMDVYQIISWLGWIPNLLFVEYFILKKLNEN